MGHHDKHHHKNEGHKSKGHHSKSKAPASTSFGTRTTGNRFEGTNESSSSSAAGSSSSAAGSSSNAGSSSSAAGTTTGTVQPTTAALTARMMKASFDDSTLVTKPTRLIDGATNHDLEGIDNRIATTKRVTMRRLIEGGSSPVLNMAQALLGFALMSRSIQQRFGKSSLYVLLGRSPTAIGAWLQSHGCTTCMLPFSGARLDTGGPTAEQQARVYRHFDNMLRPYLQAMHDNIVIIDYSTSGESILTVYRLMADYLTHIGHTPYQQNDGYLRALSLWARGGARRASLFDVIARRMGLAGIDQTSFINWLLGQRPKIEHLFIEEGTQDGFGSPLGWSNEIGSYTYDSMMSMLDNQGFDILSAYDKTKVLEGAPPESYMSAEGWQRYLRLQSELETIEQEHLRFIAMLYENMLKNTL